MKERLERLDKAQQARPALAIPFATVKKFGEDKSSNLAATMAFWAFFSIFPLLLAGITVLTWVLPEDERARVLEQVAGYFPLLDVSTIGGLSGSVFALVVGLAAALWSGSAVVRVTQDAFNSVWEVPRNERPKIVEQVKRSILALATIGVGLVASTAMIGFVSGDNPAIDLGPLSRVLAFGLAIALDVGLFIVAFRMLTDRQITLKDVLPGAVFSGLAFWVLQTISSIIITRHLSSAQGTYGNFATVITILWWFYLQSQLTLLGAQVNVVLKRRYWPRSMVGGPDTEADRRVLTDYAREQTFVDGQKINVRLPAQGADGSHGAGRGDGKAAREQTVAELFGALSDQTRRLVREEIALAGMELKTKGRAAGKGLGLLGAAGVVAWFATAALVAGLVLLAAELVGALAGLVLGGVLVVLTLALALLGRKQVGQVGPLAPRHALDEIRADVAVLKERIHR